MDATFDQFLKGCYEAGPEVCELARSSDRLWTDVARRAWGHFATLEEAPRGVVAPNGYTVVVRGKDFRDFAGVSMYKPILTFKLLAHVINESINGNDEELVKLLYATGSLPNIEAECHPSETTGNATLFDVFEADAVNAVICVDGDDVTDKDMTFWRSYVDQLNSVSKLWGSNWAEIRFPCSSWGFKTNWSFKGPFTTPHADSVPSADRPSAPLLFLSNRFDPVTPVSAARAMAAQHPGAQLVVQESMGHGVAVGTPSNCTDRIVAEYFDKGVIPEEETLCEANCGPWDGNCEMYKAGPSARSAHHVQFDLTERLPLAL